MKVSHNAESGEIDIYINNEYKTTVHDNGDEAHYFKLGVYT
jgi:hypothetical protein